MAYTGANGNANEILAYNAGKPVLVASNAAESFNSAAVWRTIEDIDIDAGHRAKLSNTDADNASFPTSFVHDRFAHLVTKPTSSTSAGYGLIFDLNEDATISTVVISGHNFDLMAAENATFAVEVRIADDSNFDSFTSPSNVEVMATWDSFLDGRPLSAFGLGSAHSNDTQGSSFREYTAAKWIQIACWNADKVDMTTMPQIGECFLGTRGQMSRNPSIPWDDRHLVSATADFVAKSQVRGRYTFAAGQRVFTPTWRPTGTDRYGLDDVTTLEDWYEDTTFGTQPFFFTPSPLSDPRSTYFVHLDDAQQNLVHVDGADVRQDSYVFREAPPFVSGV